MRNSKLIVFGLLVMFLSAGLMACSSGDDAVTEDETVAEQPAGEAQVKTVTLYKYQFNPSTLTVQAGTIVGFSNKDPEQHNVSIAALNIDETLAAGESFQLEFNTPGEFAVNNRFSSSPMKMTIVVE